MFGSLSQNSILSFSGEFSNTSTYFCLVFPGGLWHNQKPYLGETLKCYYVLIELACRLNWKLAVHFGIIAGFGAWLSFWQPAQLAEWLNYILLSRSLVAYVYACDSEWRIPAVQSLLSLLSSSTLLHSSVCLQQTSFRCSPEPYDAGYSTWQQVGGRGGTPLAERQSETWGSKISGQFISGKMSAVYSRLWANHKSCRLSSKCVSLFLAATHNSLLAWLQKYILWK